jgi:uncharacterized cysteine cluster protein YcgN (CxxCxxCC family)
MTDPIKRDGLRPRFWEKHALKKLTQAEWEALCDGCGKCCLNKLEDPDTGEVALTKIACKLLDDSTCHCSQYEIRKQIVPICVVLTPKNISENAYWMPETCAYRVLYEGRKLAAWHPLVSGDPNSVHAAGVSVQGWTIPEYEIDEEDWEDYIIEEPV